MDVKELGRLAQTLQCQIAGIPDVRGALHCEVVAIVAQNFDEPDARILCEPTLIRSTHRPPDIVLLAPEVGVQVFEVKQIGLEQIEAIEAGGQIRIKYAAGSRSRNVIAQVRNAMFDIKDTAQRLCDRDLSVPFQYWVAFPQISRRSWCERWGDDGYCPNPA